MIYTRPPATGAYVADTAAMDWFVIATLCFLFFLLGCFATVAWQIRRRTTRPDPHIRLLMELENEKADLESSDDEHPPQSPPPPHEPWERKPDWWKQ